MKCPTCQFENRENAKFCNECGSALSEVAETQRPVPTSEGERKHATVLFSDLSGYTAMTERLDPEDVKAIMSRIFGEIEQVVTKYEGVVERFFGDEVMALFGVPIAHEDDPVRAIRAAIEIQNVVKGMSPEYEMSPGQPLAMHIGINSGLVITGDEYIGKGRHGLTGDTINLAARLTKLAQAGEVLVGLDTYSQAEGYFTFESMEPIQVKGKEEPVQVFKVLSPKEQPTKVHRTHGVRAELIGREAEMAQLGEAVERLRGGQGSIVSICGDAGTGKSRLVEEFKASLDLEEIQWREGHAYAYCQNIPYFPVMDMMNRAWEIEEGDPPGRVREKIESSIAYLFGEKEDIVPYVGGLYALDYPEIEGIDPEFWKTRLHQAIQKILSALAQRAPMVVCLEDLHWADPSSLDLLRFILSESSHPALFLCVYRSHFELFSSHQLSTLEKPYHEIRLQDLSPAQAQDMAESLLKTNAIPTELQRFVQEKVDGNPFYLEEVINSLIESETLIRDNGAWRLTRSISESGISPTIHGIISGRLDRLEKETKRILQEASVIGRAFLYEILKRITELIEHIDGSLSRLEGLDLIRTRSLQPELEYIFKHALTQEVVYNGLLKTERQSIHERIGLVMEQLFYDRLSEFYESLAFHFKQGLSILKAVDYLMKAGEKSLQRYAVEEAHQYYKEGFDLLANKSDKSTEEERLLIDLLNQWSKVFYYLGDFKMMNEVLAPHETMAQRLNDKTRLGIFYVWLGNSVYMRGTYRDAYQLFVKALELGEQIEDQKIIGHACMWLSWTSAELGLHDDAIRFGERAHKIAQHLGSDHFLYFKCLSAMGHSRFFTGESKKSFELGEMILNYGNEHSDVRSLVFGQITVGHGHLNAGDLSSAIECYRAAMEISEDPFYVQAPRVALGMCYVQNNQFQEAEEALEEVLSYGTDFGCEILSTTAKAFLGVTLIATGRFSHGLAMLHDVRQSCIANERRSFYALIEYALGKVYMQIAQRASPITLSTIVKNIGFLVKNVPFASKKAKHHFEKAIEVMRDIGAKGLLGQASLDLGLLHIAKGRTGEARKCLSEAIQLFEQCEAEGYLKRAKEALASL